MYLIEMQQQKHIAFDDLLIRIKHDGVLIIHFFKIYPLIMQQVQQQQKKTLILFSSTLASFLSEI